MAPPSPRNKWRYGLTALACMAPAALTFEKALALVDKGAVPSDKRNHNAKTLADGWDATLWHRLPAGGPKAFASVAVWRYDRRDQHDFRWRDDVLVLGLHVGFDDTPFTDNAAREGWTRFLLELGDILRPDFMALDLYDEFMDRKGKDLTREVFALNVYGPAIVSRIGETNLRAAPAADIDNRPWGAVVVRATNELSIASAPQARDPIVNALWPSGA
ncbi:MAG: hypothetical protein E6K16_07455 [Methanobacteriota archaeon]|nr:MAG: hypothetical protein E6K16_07455 [Euryarchaeota archaeon]